MSVVKLGFKRWLLYLKFFVSLNLTEKTSAQLICGFFVIYFKGIIGKNQMCKIR